MDAIELMMEEHENIKVMLKIVRKVCYFILEGKEVNFDDFNKIISFHRRNPLGYKFLTWLLLSL